MKVNTSAEWRGHQRFRILILALLTAAVWLFSLGLERWQRYYRAVLDRQASSDAVSPIEFGTRLSFLDGVAPGVTPRESYWNLVIRVDSVGRGRARRGLCEALSKAGQAPGSADGLVKLYLRFSPDLDACSIPFPVHWYADLVPDATDDGPQEELRRARWALADETGRVLYSGRGAPDLERVRDIKALLSTRP